MDRNRLAGTTFVGLIVLAYLFAGMLVYYDQNQQTPPRYTLLFTGILFSLFGLHIVYFWRELRQLKTFERSVWYLGSVAIAALLVGGVLAISYLIELLT